MPQPDFKRILAIDWSGAEDDKSKHIAVAEIDVVADIEMTGPPRLVCQSDCRRWRRLDVLEYLRKIARDGPPTLVGCDFNFSLPICVTERHGVVAGPDLWALVEHHSGGADDLYGVGYAEHADHRCDFWLAGPRPWAEPFRSTELACLNQDLGQPESTVKLIGGKQVGRGGLAGMRMLAALAGEPSVHIWPFDDGNLADARLVLVEIFPRIYLGHAGWGNQKIVTGPALDDALDALGAPRAGLVGKLSDHDTDALISAAGMRQDMGDDAMWNAPPEGIGQREGWIFGVPAPQ